MGLLVYGMGNEQMPLKDCCVYKPWADWELPGVFVSECKNTEWYLRMATAATAQLCQDGCLALELGDAKKLLCSCSLADCSEPSELSRGSSP